MTVAVRSEVSPAAGPIILTASLGLFLATLDTGIINIALPTLTHVFGVPVSTMSWSVTLYMLCLIVVLLPLGQWADRLGRVKFFAIGLTIFLVSSVWLALSPSVGWFIAGRALQGLGGAFLQATSSALLTTQLAPAQRRHGLATLGMIQGFGTVIGPGLGGLILASVGWRWLFWINVPLCLLGLYGSGRYFAKTAPNPNAADTNLGSAVLLGGSLLAMFTALDALSLPSAVRWGSGAVALALLAVFALRERAERQPLILPEVQKGRALQLLLGVWSVIGLVTPALFLVPPFVWVNVNHLATSQAGLLALVSPLFFAISARLNPFYKKHFSTMQILTGGLLIMGAGLVLGGFAAGHLSPIFLAAALGFYGIGGGAAQVESMTALTLLVSQEKQATLGATQRLVINVSIALATAAVTAVISHGDLLARSQWILWVSGLVALAYLLTLPTLNRAIHHDLQEHTA